MITEYLYLEYENLKAKKLLSTPEQLESFIIQHKKLFGSFRRRAYEKFIELREDLENQWNEQRTRDAEIIKEAEYDR
jgi:hypothetical protein